MKKTVKKQTWVLITLILLILSGLCYGCSCSRTSNNDVQNNNTQNSDGLILTESSQMKENAKSFYQAAYAKDYATLTGLMTDAYAAAFEQTQQTGDDGGRNDGTAYLLNLDERTSVQKPNKIDSPVASEGDVDYYVKLELSDSQTAYVCFSKVDDTYKVCRFNLETINDETLKEKGGYMGSGYQD